MIFLKMSGRHFFNQEGFCWMQKNIQSNYHIIVMHEGTFKQQQFT